MELLGPDFVSHDLGLHRLAIGARVKITAGGMTQTEEIHSGGSYLSQNDLRVHFGLGKDERARVEVRWPGGAVQDLGEVEGGRYLTVREP